MPSNLLRSVVFLAGLVALAWVGAGYIGTNTLALPVLLLIGACYVAGAVELQRYHQATTSLARALTALDRPVPQLADWIASVPASLRHAVRQRIESERVPLPAPALTPYLVGLLVLLGMLGTLLGMTATLRGTGLALESATDIDAIRASLGAPVKGLAFAFGTSIAGVAASAMLGLLSALCRRERAATVQVLDAAIATTLRPYSSAYQREEAFRLLQKQVDVMPVLVDRLQTMMAALEQQGLAASARQLAQQTAFHDRTEAVHARLAASVEQSLTNSVTEGARAAGAALQPVVEGTMAALTQSAASLHAGVLQAMEQQLAGLTRRLHDSTATVAGLWTDALVEQRRSNEALLTALDGSLERFSGRFDERATGMVEAVANRFEAASSVATSAWSEALSHQGETAALLARNNEQALDRAAATFGSHAASLVDAVERSHQAMEAALDVRAQSYSALVDRVATGFESASAGAATAWESVRSQQAALGEDLARRNEQALSAAAAAFESHAASMVDAVRASHHELRTALEQQAQASAAVFESAATRFETTSVGTAAAWADALTRQAALGEALARNNEQALTTAAATFESHARALVDAVQHAHAELQGRLEAQMQMQARATLSEIARLVHDAAEAPKAAAVVIAELRQSLSESLVRDTATLEERGRLLATVETLLGAVNHASAEQRAAVDALIATSADALERVATRLTDRVEAETGRLDAAADRITAGAIEVASLGDVFGVALQRFGDSNDQLAARLQAIEEALGHALARSDEQLAYYVAQAREVVDLSVLAQKQIVGELQHLARPRAPAGVDAA